MKIKGFLLIISSLRVEALAFFPFIFSKYKSPGQVLLNHERIHLKQQLELGILPFYIWYFSEYLIRLIQHKKHYLAYLHISFEQEAYLNQSDPDYLKNRRLWAFWKYL